LEEEDKISKSGDDVTSCLTIGFQPSLEQTVQIVQDGNILPQMVLSDMQDLVKEATFQVLLLNVFLVVSDYN